ncbi:protein unc-93 homolog A-like [Watersipora subatra]|uniref:protein unc-93 homolog A-like n=1 Tax=Watersipora subatra TaxID=2589382 RepID=UPI00355C25B1
MKDKNQISVVKLSDEPATEADETPEFESISQIWRNAIVLSVVFLVLFTAFGPVQDLQSSLFKEGGMGTTVLAILYGAFVISGFLVVTPLINSIGSKWTLVISIVCYITYVAAHFHATWGVFIPAAVMAGMGAAPLWAAKGHYLNTLAHDYAKKKGVSNDAAVNLFFGVFYLFMTSSSVWGNIISSQVLTPSDANYSIAPLSAEELKLCGKAFCPQNTAGNNTNLLRPPESKLYMLAGIYTGCTCIALIIVSTLLQKLPVEMHKSGGLCAKANCKPKLLIAAFLQLKDKRQLLLIPITIHTGLQHAFFGSDYTQAFITCSFGNWWVGYAIICYGTAGAICSLLFGKLVQFVGRIPFFTLAAAVNVTLITIYLSTDITPDNIYRYLIYAAIWGMGDSTWRTQTLSLYGVIFRDNSEAAFSNSMLWKSMGYITAFAYQSRLCFSIKAYILLANLGLGMIGYFTVEYIEYRKCRAAYKFGTAKERKKDVQLSFMAYVDLP